MRIPTVEFSCPFPARHLDGLEATLHPMVCAAIRNCPCRHVTGTTVRLSASQQLLIGALRQPPVAAAAQPLWHQCKALELAVTLLLQPPPGLNWRRRAVRLISLFPARLSSRLFAGFEADFFSRHLAPTRATWRSP